mgnify:CR=1 FL=1
MQTSIKALILCVILCISLVTALQFGSTFIPLDQIIQALMSMADPNATATMTDTITSAHLFSLNRYRFIPRWFTNANGYAKCTR